MIKISGLEPSRVRVVDNVISGAGMICFDPLGAPTIEIANNVIVDASTPDGQYAIAIVMQPRGRWRRFWHAVARFALRRAA